MARERYEEWNPKPQAVELVRMANVICADMARQGYDLTLRQLYYQFVARALIPNTERSYKNLGNVISRARLAGLLDWRYIVDRTRSLRGLDHSIDAADLVGRMQDTLHLDHWLHQPYRVEVWVEKEALVSVVGRAAVPLDVDFFACKGYVSQSELHAAAKRHLEYEAQQQQVVVIHLGDHDPSGLDMTRDMADRLATFGASTMVERIALNRDQIDQYAPPPNPAKLTDSRAGDYIREHGRSSWELDALQPAVLDQLISSTIAAYLDLELFTEVAAIQSEARKHLAAVSAHWPRVAAFVSDLEDE